MHSLARGLCPLRMRGSMEHLIRTRYRCASSSRAREIIRSPYIRSRHAARTGASARNLNASRIISIRNATPQGDDPRAISATLRDVSMFTSKSRPAATDPRHGSIRPVSLNNSAARFYRLDFVSPFESRSRTRATDSHPRISLPEIKLASPSIPLSPPPLSLSLSLSRLHRPIIRLSFYPSCAAPCPFRASLLSSPRSYFISVPSSSLASSAIPPCSPVVGSADFFLGYRPVDRAAIRWTAIRIDYSLPKLRRGAFILYNSPAALVPPSSCSFLCFFVARYNRASSRARRHPWAHSCERKTTGTHAFHVPPTDVEDLNNIFQMPRHYAARRGAPARAPGAHLDRLSGSARQTNEDPDERHIIICSQ